MSVPSPNEAINMIQTSIGFIIWAKDTYQKWEQSRLGRSKEEKRSSTKFDNISDFWKAVKEDHLDEGSFVSIQGQLSKYTPFLIGPPKTKRDLHLGYRKNLQAGTTKSRRSEINALLAYTAGQMVWRLDLESTSIMYLGLFHSIVRNSIPIFVDGEYYRRYVEKFFRESSNKYTVEARITGVVKSLSSKMDIIDTDQLKGFIQPRILEDAGKPVFGIMVDGGNTSIEYVDEARYLDGDIWVALESNQEQCFISRFVDLADINDLKEESKRLKEDVKEFHPAAKIVFQFDQVDMLFPEYKSTSVEALLEQL